MSDPSLAILEQKLDALLASTAAPKRFFTVIEAGSYTGLSPESIRQALATGGLVACRPIAGRLLIDKSDLDSWVLGAKGRVVTSGRGIRGSKQEPAA